MPLLVGKENGGNHRTVIRSLFSLAVVFLLTVGVVAGPEEQIAAVQDQQPQQVALSTISFYYLVFIAGAITVLTPDAP